MVETLEHFIRQAADHPRHGRAHLYKELLRSETYLLTLDEPIKEEQTTRVSKANDTFPIWADKDAELGGVWVPVFPSRDSVASFVTTRRLKAPRGKEFLWMGHKPGAVFGMLKAVKCFAGIRLHLSSESHVSLGWSEVKTLAEGQVPEDAPELYEMPLAKLSLPMGMRLLFGKIDAGPQDHRAKLMCLPEAGHFTPDDARRLVRLPMSSGPVWMPCRHFLQILKFLGASTDDAPDGHIEDLLLSMIGFQMYGEAEALAEWLLKEKDEPCAWTALGAIYARTGRFEDLALFCRRALARHPEEKAFALTGAKALAKLGRYGDARHMLEAALERFPGDAKVLEALKALP
jgi:tetratricopeptide (TPR) repeat protein